MRYAAVILGLVIVLVAGLFLQSPITKWDWIADIDSGGQILREIPMQDYRVGEWTARAVESAALIIGLGLIVAGVRSIIRRRNLNRKHPAGG